MSEIAKHPLEVFKFCPKCGCSRILQRFGRAIFCSHCGFEYFFNSSGAVIAIILNDAGELLVTRRAHEPAKGTLDLPGGFIDPDESAEDTVRREIREELNLEVNEIKYLYTVTNRYPYSGIIIHTVDLVFKVEVNDFSSIKAADDVEECFFIPAAELKDGMFGMKSCNEVIRKWDLL